jgi:hypothetical protein
MELFGGAAAEFAVRGEQFLHGQLVENLLPKQQEDSRRASRFGPRPLNGLNISICLWSLT